MSCKINKIDSNVSGIAYAEEECLKELPAQPIWQALEPNSFSDFGGETTSVKREPISSSRQNKKGKIVDVNASAGFNIDFTQNNLTDLLQGFFFADARQLPSTAPLNAPKVAVSAVTATSKTYAVASGGVSFKTGMLVKASGFSKVANNGIKTVASSTATTIVVNNTLVDETPSANAKLDVVGFKFAADDISLTVTDQLVAISSAGGNFPNSLIQGQWVFLGSDLATARFADNVGFARIKEVSASTITFDDVTWSPSNDLGVGKSIEMFTGTIIKNEEQRNLIKRRSYNFERTLGEGEVSTQAEYLEGAVANEFKLTIPTTSKLAADLSFVACDVSYRSGDAGDELKTGDRKNALGEDPITTSSDIYRMRLAIDDPNVSNKANLFAYISDGSVTINNGVSGLKAIGQMGSFDTTCGNFTVTGELNAFFTTVEAVRAVRNNADIGFSVISSTNNAGFIFDIPLLGFDSGKISVEKDQPIKLPLTGGGAENSKGYTALYEVFNYLPNIAMPQ